MINRRNENNEKMSQVYQKKLDEAYSKIKATDPKLTNAEIYDKIDKEYLYLEMLRPANYQRQVFKDEHVQPINPFDVPLDVPQEAIEQIDPIVNSDVPNDVENVVNDDVLPPPLPSENNYNSFSNVPVSPSAATISIPVKKEKQIKDMNDDELRQNIMDIWRKLSMVTKGNFDQMSLKEKDTFLADSAPERLSKHKKAIQTRNTRSFDTANQNTIDMIDVWYTEIIAPLRKEIAASEEFKRIDILQKINRKWMDEFGVDFSTMDPAKFNDILTKLNEYKTEYKKNYQSDKAIIASYMPDDIAHATTESSILAFSIFEGLEAAYEEFNIRVDSLKENLINKAMDLTDDIKRFHRTFLEQEKEKLSQASDKMEIGDADLINFNVEAARSLSFSIIGRDKTLAFTGFRGQIAQKETEFNQRFAALQTMSKGIDFSDIETSEFNLEQTYRKIETYLTNGTDEILSELELKMDTNEQKAFALQEKCEEIEKIQDIYKQRQVFLDGAKKENKRLLGEVNEAIAGRDHILALPKGPTTKDVLKDNLSSKLQLEDELKTSKAYLKFLTSTIERCEKQGTLKQGLKRNSVSTKINVHSHNQTSILQQEEKFIKLSNESKRIKNQYEERILEIEKALSENRQVTRQIETACLLNVHNTGELFNKLSNESKRIKNQYKEKISEIEKALSNNRNVHNTGELFNKLSNEYKRIKNQYEEEILEIEKALSNNRNVHSTGELFNVRNTGELFKDILTYVQSSMHYDFLKKHARVEKGKQVQIVAYLNAIDNASNLYVLLEALKSNPEDPETGKKMRRVRGKFSIFKPNVSTTDKHATLLQKELEDLIKDINENPELAKNPLAKNRTAIEPERPKKLLHRNIKG